MNNQAIRSLKSLLDEMSNEKPDSNEWGLVGECIGICSRPEMITVKDCVAALKQRFDKMVDDGIDTPILDVNGYDGFTQKLWKL